MTLQVTEAESKEKHGVGDPTVYVGSDYNLNLCPFQSQLQHIYHGQPYAESTYTRVDFIPQSGTLHQHDWDFKV